jgi:hypothetical protein
MVPLSIPLSACELPELEGDSRIEEAGDPGFGPLGRLNTNSRVVAVDDYLYRLQSLG